MKAYKAFNKDMTCRGFQYEEGKSYEEPEAKLCKKGFHACEAPVDVFNYYYPANSVIHEVELDDVSDERNDDTKVCAKKIKIGAKINIPKLCKLQFEYVKSHCTEEYAGPKIATAGDHGAATAGHYGVATAEDYGAATAGHHGVATARDRGAAAAGIGGAATAGYLGVAIAGDSGAATAGVRGAATVGYRGAATAGVGGVAFAKDSGTAAAGYRGVATAGYRGVAATGDSGAAAAGDYGVATSRGSVKVGKYGIGTVRGKHVCISGGFGAMLTIAEEKDWDGHDIKYWESFVVDGEQYKANTWYRFNEDGNLIENGSSADK